MHPRRCGVVTLEDGITCAQRLSGPEVQAMNGEPVLYDPETDTLLVELRPWPAASPAEVNDQVGGEDVEEGLVVHYGRTACTPSEVGASACPPPRLASHGTTFQVGPYSPASIGLRHVASYEGFAGTLRERRCLLARVALSALRRPRGPGRDRRSPELWRDALPALRPDRGALVRGRVHAARPDDWIISARKANAREGTATW